MTKFSNQHGEITLTTGTGDITLAGSLGGRFVFSSNYANGDTFPYRLRDGEDLEFGTGTFNSGPNSVSRSPLLTIVGGVFDDTSPVAINIASQGASIELDWGGVGLETLIGGGSIFDQSLNTTDSPTFAGLAVTGGGLMIDAITDLSGGGITSNSDITIHNSTPIINLRVTGDTQTSRVQATNAADTETAQITYNHVSKSWSIANHLSVMAEFNDSGSFVFRDLKVKGTTPNGLTFVPFANTSQSRITYRNAADTDPVVLHIFDHSTQVMQWQFAPTFASVFELDATGVRFDTLDSISGGGIDINANLNYDGNDFRITANTLDGFDTSRIAISAGGTASTTRGAMIFLNGNEHASEPGDVDIRAGDTGEIFLRDSTTIFGNFEVRKNTAAIQIIDTLGDLGFNQTMLRHGNDIFAIQIRTDGALLVENMYSVDLALTGAVSHSWNVGASELMSLDATGLLIDGISSLTGSIEIFDNILANDVTITAGAYTAERGVFPTTSGNVWAQGDFFLSTDDDNAMMAVVAGPGQIKWLQPVASSKTIQVGIHSWWEKTEFTTPIGVVGYATGSLPDPTTHQKFIVYDTTTDQFKGSNGTTWNVLG